VITSTSTALLEVEAEDQIQVSEDGGTVWVHALDGSTVGRFSKRFGVDVHRTMTAQISGEEQCLSCTHEPACPEDWRRFVDLMKQHHEITVPLDLISFPAVTSPI
jgi:hypothetical protein